MSQETQQTESDSTELPERSFGWEQIDYHLLDDGVLFSPDVGRIETNRSNYSTLDGNEIGFLPDDRILTEYDTTEIDVPTYYSRFDQFDTLVSELDTGYGNSVAWGITPQRLEDAIRVVVGGGRFRSDDLSVHVLDNEPIFVVQYDGATWVVSTTTLKSLPEEYEYDTTEINGFTVPDDSDTVLRGMERFLDLLPEHYDETVVGYDRLTGSGYHYFERNDESTFGIKGSYLQRLGKVAHDPDEVQTDYQIETEYDEEYSVSWDDVSCEIGDSVSEIYGGNTREERERKECVAGYQMQWEDPRTSSRVSMNGKIVARATYFYILYRDEYDRYEVRDRDERLAEFDPENKEWSPLATSDR